MLGAGQCPIQLPTGGFSVPLYRRDLVSVVKALKSNIKNGQLCREYVVVLHARLFEDEKGGRDSFNKFIANTTAGIATVLATVDHHASDVAFGEVALVFLYNLAHYGGRRQPRVVAKLVKKGGCRTVVSALNKNATQTRVVHPACMLLIAMSSMDSKLPAMARLSGALSNLVWLLRSHVTVATDVTASILCCLCSLARGETNLLQLAKKGSVPLLCDLLTRNLNKPALPMLKWACKLLVLLCGVSDVLVEVVSEGGVSLALGLLCEQTTSVDTQRLCLDLLGALLRHPDGAAEFTSRGGFDFVVTTLLEGNADKGDIDMAELLAQTYKFFGETELPISKDNDLYWTPPGAAGSDGDGVDGAGLDGSAGGGGASAAASAAAAAGNAAALGEGSSAAGGTGSGGGGRGGVAIGDDEDEPSNDAASSSDEADGGAGSDTDANEQPEYCMADFSPELNGGEVSAATAFPENIVVHHVKPFTEQRPSASCPSCIDFVPPVEELLMQTAATRVAILRAEFRRFLRGSSPLIRQVVYDDLERSSVLPTTHLSKTAAASAAAGAPAASTFATAAGGAAAGSRGAAATLRAAAAAATAASSSGASASQPASPVIATPPNATVAPLPFHASSPASAIPPLKFGSNFESGNLKRAIQILDTEYDLILHTDINTQTYVQWFFFSVEHALPDVTYTFNIINMEKPTSTFSEGQRPLLFSEKRFTLSGFGWLRSGFNILYHKNSYGRRVTKRKKLIGTTFHTLTFSLRFPHSQDRCYLANCYPYTYSDLVASLTRPETAVAHGDHMILQSLCQSEAGNPTPLVTITQLRRADGTAVSREEILQRRVCIVSARVHPGESNSSYMAKGLMEFLLANTEVSAQLREGFVWKIVPMLNPDGVINGNHRCSLAGKDLNREFLKPSRRLCPTVFYLKELVRQLKLEGRNIVLYGDFHGHSRRRNFFAYACGGSSKKLVHGVVVEKVFPRILSELAPYFSYEGSTYKVQRAKRTTGRVVFYKEFGIRMSYTVEGSMMGGDACEFVPLSWCPVEEDVARRTAVARMTRGHFNTAHFCVFGAMFAKTALMVLQGEGASSGRAFDAVSRLLIEAAVAKQQQHGNAKQRHHSLSAVSGGSSASTVGGGGGAGNSGATSGGVGGSLGSVGSSGGLLGPQASPSDDAGDLSSSSMSGAYVQSRRNSFRRSAVAAAAANSTATAASGGAAGSMGGSATGVSGGGRGVNGGAGGGAAVAIPSQLGNGGKASAVPSRGGSTTQKAPLTANPAEMLDVLTALLRNRTRLTVASAGDAGIGVVDDEEQDDDDLADAEEEEDPDEGSGDEGDGEDYDD